MNNYKNKLEKYNEKSSRLLLAIQTGGMINILPNYDLLDKNDNRLQPYNKSLDGQDELDELLYFQMFVLPNVKLYGIQLGVVAGNNLVANAGGHDSIIYLATYDSNKKIIIKVQQNAWQNDIKNYKLLGENIPSSFIKMYGAFVNFDNVDRILDASSISYSKTKNVTYNHQLKNTYMLFESADGNSRDIIEDINKIKQYDPKKWMETLNNFIVSIITGLKYLHLDSQKENGFIHLDIKPENIVYAKNLNGDYIFKIIDLGTMKKYVFGSTVKYNYVGSPKYNFINANSPYRDYNNLWLSICQIFMLIPGQFNYFTKDDKSITALIKSLFESTRSLSSEELIRKIDLRSVYESDLTKRIETNLSRMHSAYNEYNINENGKSNIQKNILHTYSANFILSEPKSHESSLEDIYYKAIRDGIKIYETRVYDDKRRKMNVGDIWIFKHNENPELPVIKTTITEIKIYKSFREAIEDTGPNKLLPQTDNVEEATKIYDGFNNGNYKIDAETYGVVRFKLALN